MKQQQVIQKKQKIQQKIAQHTRKSQVPVQVQDHPYLQAQGIIGNHGVLRRHPGIIQAKLTVDSPGDKYEQQADQVADTVMQTSESAKNGQEELIQTKPIAEQITSLLQKQPIEEEEEKLMPKEAPGRTPVVTPNVRAQINAMKGSGYPLPKNTRAFFEQRFGCDFSQVRVHTGTLAAEAAKSVNARAFTMGRDVVFGRGYYSTATETGRRLLSHELTHVVQNNSSSQPQIHHLNRAPDSEQSSADEPGTTKPRAEDPGIAKPQADEPGIGSKKMRWTDLSCSPFLTCVWHDVITKEGLTLAEFKKLKLNGTEAAAFYPWLYAFGMPFLQKGGTLEGSTYMDYAEDLAILTPSKDHIMDILSRIAGIRLDDYLASDKFKERLKANIGDVIALASVAQIAYSTALMAVGTSAEAGEFEQKQWSKHIQFAVWMINKLFKEHLKAPDFFDVGPLQLMTHPAFSATPFAGGAPPSGFTLEGSKGEGKGEGGEESKLSVTLNVQKLGTLSAESGPSAEDIADLQKYRGLRATIWLGHEKSDPTATMKAAGKLPSDKLKVGTILGAGGHIALLEAGSLFRGRDASSLTSFFLKGGYGYSWPKGKFFKRFGFTATYLDWKETDVLAPRSKGGIRQAGGALRITPFAKVGFAAGKRHRFAAGAALSFVTGSAEPLNISGFRGDLSYEYRGDRSPDGLPVFKLDLSGSVHRLDWWNPNSPLLWGVQAKGVWERWFAGAQVMSGAGAIPEERARMMGETMKVRVPTSLLFIGGYSF